MELTLLYFIVCLWFARSRSRQCKS